MNYYLDTTTNKIYKKIGEEMLQEVGDDSNSIHFDLDDSKFVLLAPSIIRKNTAILPLEDHENTETKPEFYRKTIADVPKIFYNFKQSDCEETEKVLHEIKKNIITVLQRTMYKPTIEKTYFDYLNTVKALKHNDLTKLYEINKTLKARIERQKSPAEMQKTLDKRLKRKRIFYFLCFGIIIVSSFLIYTKLNNDNTSVNLTQQQIDSVLKTLNYKSDWRREYIYMNCINLQIDEEGLIKEIELLNKKLDK